MCWAGNTAELQYCTLLHVLTYARWLHSFAVDQLIRLWVQGNLGHTKHGLKVIFKSVSLWLGHQQVGQDEIFDRHRPMLTWNCTTTITSVTNASVTTIKNWRHQMSGRQKTMISLTNNNFAPFKGHPDQSRELTFLHKRNCKISLLSQVKI